MRSLTQTAITLAGAALFAMAGPAIASDVEMEQHSESKTEVEMDDGDVEVSKSAEIETETENDVTGVEHETEHSAHSTEKTTADGGYHAKTMKRTYERETEID